MCRQYFTGLPPALDVVGDRREHSIAFAGETRDLSRPRTQIPQTRKAQTMKNCNGQVLVRKTKGRSPKHQFARIWVVRCGRPGCGHEYGANGSDAHLHKCPCCQGNAAGLNIQLPEVLRQNARRAQPARSYNSRCRKSARTTTPGYRNRNDQTVIRDTSLPGNDHNQRTYELDCSKCGNRYGANGSDIWQRRCPKCGGGRPGLPYE